MTCVEPASSFKLMFLWYYACTTMLWTLTCQDQQHMPWPVAVAGEVDLIPIALARSVAVTAVHCCPQMECERVNVVDEVGPGSCRLSVEGHIIVRLFGIGRLAERIIIESTHKTLRALPAIIER